MWTYSLQILLHFSLNLIAQRSWWEIIPEGVQLLFSFAVFFISLLVLAVVLYFAGLIIVGGRRARFSEAFLISLIGNVLSTVFFLFLPYSIISLLLSAIVWLLLIKRFYRTGWVGAVAVGILAVIVFLVVAIFLALFFGILWEILRLFTSL
jgi:hypothetical protein